MRRLAWGLMAGVGLVAGLRCGAETGCRAVVVPASVEAAAGELSLADLLPRDSCPQLRAAAQEVSLGAAPRAGSERVFDGRQIRGWLEGFANQDSGLKGAAGVEVPERIVVQSAGAAKSCAEIASFVAAVAPAREMASTSKRWREDMNCAGARGVPGGAALELVKASWNEGLQRWEFALRCVRAGDCVPFLVWTRGEDASGTRRDVASPGRRMRKTAAGTGTGQLIKPGQTATLTWEQSGIRVVLPVTCLDGVGLGQLVRIRFKNGAQTLRAEVVGAGSLRAGL